MSEEAEPIQRRARIFKMLRAACEALVGQDAGMPAGEVIERVREKVPPTDLELTRNKSGHVRYNTNLRFWSVDLVKAGWIKKSDGRWFLTQEGKQALEAFPDAGDFGSEASRRYKEWKRARKAEQEQKVANETQALVAAVAAKIPEGKWASFTDVADVTGTASTTVGIQMWNDQPPGWHRVARKEGLLSAEIYGMDDRSDEQRSLLVAEGLDPDGALPTDRQMTRGELAGIVAEVKGGDRAWFVRGTSVHGASVIPEWLAESFVSLPASMLPELVFPVDDAAMKAAVDSGYSTLGYSQREAKYEEIRAFVRRIRSGDLILTVSGEDAFLGRVVGDVSQFESPGKRSNLRRPVEWLDADSPIAFADLSSRMQGRLGATSDIVELTDLLEELHALRRDAEGVDAEDELIDAPSVLEVELPDLPEQTVRELLIEQAWLQEFVELLRMKKQVILYGPPGTGKTFLAQEVAEALGGKGHVTLVQFHPSYAYEDFFEGYRPAPGREGHISLQLVPGPFRKVVDLARANPTEPYFLIIDEINRANLAKVFGELYFLLEYRDRSIDLLYSSGDSGPAFSLPANIYIIGTMNTADRSIALVDAAMRRRFGFLSLHPEDEQLDLVLRAWLAERELPQDRADLLVELNKRIADKDFKIGPSYLMSPWAADDAGLERIWKTSILPLLQEYHVGDALNVKKKYGLETLRAALASDDPPPPAGESSD